MTNTIDRRALLLRGASLVAGTGFAAPARAVEVCYQPNRCDAKIQTTQFPHVTQPFGSNFCWAATIAMICTWYGHPMSIDDVVTQTFGAEVNLPADPVTLINSVNRSYTDHNGAAFSLSARVWSVFSGAADIDNSTLIAELTQTGRWWCATRAT